MLRNFALLAALAAPIPASAETVENAPRSFGDFGPVGGPRHAGAAPVGLVPRDADPVQLFVEANVIETLYHELAHVLIDQLDLAVYGPEEFAADMFAVVLMNRMFDEHSTVRMAYDVAASYDHEALKASRANGGVPMWDVHGLDRQRYFNFACLMFGANPPKRIVLAHRLGLPAPRLETCEGEYLRTARAWGAVLDGLAADAPGTSLALGLTFDQADHLSDVVAREIDRLNRVIVLPEPVAVHVVPCSEVNAFYDTESGEIMVCTELGRHFAEIAR